MPKLSIIVPVYNAEKYIGKCLESLVEQNFNDLEIIVVNDGSTDNSKEEIKKFTKNNKNILYLEKENGGLSDARNYGIANATGEYICFVDGDDFVDKNLFKSLEIYLNHEIDMIKYKMIKVDENYKEIERINGPTFEMVNGEKAFNILYGTDIMLQPACLYLYKRKFIIENNFKFPVGKYHEDFATTVLWMLKAKSFVSTNIYGYYYYQSSLSVTRGNDKEKKLRRALDLIEHYDYMEKVIDSYKISDKTKENVRIYYTNNIILKLEELEDKKDREMYINEIKKRKMIKNIKARNVKQLVKKIILNINVEWYLKLR